MTACGRCGKQTTPNMSFVLYQEPGGREAGSRNRITVCAECIAEDVGAGRVVRVSGFAFESAAPADIDV